MMLFLGLQKAIFIFNTQKLNIYKYKINEKPETPELTYFQSRVYKSKCLNQIFTYLLKQLFAGTNSNL